MNNPVSANQFWGQVASGTLPASTCGPVTPIAVPTGNSCQQPAILGPATPSTVIDPLAIDLGQCGQTSFRFTNTNSASVLTRVIFAGDRSCIEHFLCPEEGSVGLEDAPFFISTDRGFFGSGANGEKIQCFGDMSANTPFFVSKVTFVPANQASADLMGQQEIQIFTIDPASDFKICDKFLEPNPCSECFTSSTSVQPITWNLGLVSVGSSSGFAIDVPAGVSGRFDLCIAGVGRNTNVVGCNVPTLSTCGF